MNLLKFIPSTSIILLIRYGISSALSKTATLLYNILLLCSRNFRHKNEFQECSNPPEKFKEKMNRLIL